MLVISRKKNEAVIIKGQEGDIRILVIEGEKGKVRLGIEAPKGYLILREELLSEIKNSNKLSAITDVQNIKRLLSGKDERDKT
ncbi:MAG: carbon storage regulator [Desulfobacterota bacterium]|nr:carbon storage regulator [Thermodesulfobacteriota bacterium]MDW8002557.1 carbon storage regulator [Deltaproteobacteria bacterium]